MKNHLTGLKFKLKSEKHRISKCFKKSYNEVECTKNDGIISTLIQYLCVPFLAVVAVAFFVALMVKILANIIDVLLGTITRYVKIKWKSL